MTPYIFDDRVNFRDVANAIHEWYTMDKEPRDACGMAGHDWVNGDESNMSAKGMSKMMADCINTCLASWTPRKKFTMYKIEQPVINEEVGII
jgi:hypothetical protein